MNEWYIPGAPMLAKVLTLELEARGPTTPFLVGWDGRGTLSALTFALVKGGELGDEEVVIGTPPAPPEPDVCILALGEAEFDFALFVDAVVLELDGGVGSFLSSLLAI